MELRTSVLVLTTILTVLYSVYGDSSTVLGPEKPRYSAKANSSSSIFLQSRKETLVSKKSRAVKGRQFYSSGPGWGWYDNRNLDLYTLLGGLAFLGLLASLFMYFNNRNTGTTVVMMNATGRRRRRDLSESDEELLGESWTDILASLGLALENPWWKSSDTDTRNLKPFQLE